MQNFLLRVVMPFCGIAASAVLFYGGPRLFCRYEPLGEPALSDAAATALGLRLPGVLLYSLHLGGGNYGKCLRHVFHDFCTAVSLLTGQALGGYEEGRSTRNLILYGMLAVLVTMSASLPSIISSVYHEGESVFSQVNMIRMVNFILSVYILACTVAHWRALSARREEAHMQEHYGRLPLERPSLAYQCEVYLRAQYRARLFSLRNTFPVRCARKIQKLALKFYQTTCIMKLNAIK